MVMMVKRRIVMLLMMMMSRKMMLGPPALVSLAQDPARGGISASLTSSLTDQCCLLECRLALPLEIQCRTVAFNAPTSLH